MEDGKLNVKVPKENTKIEARVRYEGFDTWSEWVSSDASVRV